MRRGTSRGKDAKQTSTTVTLDNTRHPSVVCFRRNGNRSSTRTQPASAKGRDTGWMCERQSSTIFALRSCVQQSGLDDGMANFIAVRAIYRRSEAAACDKRAWLRKPGIICSILRKRHANKPFARNFSLTAPPPPRAPRFSSENFLSMIADFEGRASIPVSLARNATHSCSKSDKSLVFRLN